MSRGEARSTNSRDGAMTSNKQNFLGIPTGFARANFISDIPCGPVLTLGWTTFRTVIFFDGPALDDEGAILGGGGTPRDGAGTIFDGAAQPMLVFAFFTAGFFDTSAFRLSLTT
jgi:hypothetical protein